MFSIIETLPRNDGWAESVNATAPATWGVAIEVPLKADEYESTGTLDLMLVPGAVISGFWRLLPSIVTGPRLLKEAIPSVPVTKAPTVRTSGKNEGGSMTVEQLEPELPAATTVTMPAARLA